MKKTETKTSLEYKTPKCVGIYVKTQSVLCASPLTYDSYIDDAEEEDLGTL